MNTRFQFNYVKEISKLKISSFKIENDDLTINEFMSLYNSYKDPIDEIIKVTVLTYIRNNIGEMRPKEIIDNLSQYGDSFEFYVTNFFES